MKKILVTGANGLLGQALYRELNEKKHALYFTSKNHNVNKMINYYSMDILKKQQLEELVNNIKPNIIIHCAAFTNVDLCETNKQLAFELNYKSTETLIHYCNINKCKLVFISTDYIFDGQKGQYSENFNTNPIGYYGYTKQLCEKLMVDNLNDYLIARTSVIYGYARNTRDNFVTWVIKSLLANKPLDIVKGQYGNPTYNIDLARMIIKLIEKKSAGIFNTSGLNWINRYEFALKIADIFKLNKNLLHPIESKSIIQKAKRPEYGGFVLDKIIKTINYLPMTIEEGLKDMKQRYKKVGD